jgi:hypothetical protein
MLAGFSILDFASAINASLAASIVIVAVDAMAVPLASAAFFASTAGTILRSSGE